MKQLVFAALIGAAVAYLFDRDRGRQRRDAIGGRASKEMRRLRFSELVSPSAKETAPSSEASAASSAESSASAGTGENGVASDRSAPTVGHPVP